MLRNRYALPKPTLNEKELIIQEANIVIKRSTDTLETKEQLIIWF